jgi:error-prone DNA polymerase
MKPPKPPKRRRLRAPIEPGLPGLDPHADDPRSALHKQLRRQPTALGAMIGATEQDASSCNAGIAASMDAGAAAGDVPSRYAELHCLSNFSFQRGASSARELFERAKRLGYDALAITDECSLAGIVRALEASKETGVELIVGTEVQLADGPKLVLLAQNQDGYSDICRLITAGRRRSEKGEYHVMRSDAERLGEGVLVLWLDSDRVRPQLESAAWAEDHSGSDEKIQPSGNVLLFDRKTAAGDNDSLPSSAARPATMKDRPGPTASMALRGGKKKSLETQPSAGRESCAAWLKRHFPDRTWLAVELHRGADDALRLDELQAFGARHGLPLVAAGDAHMHVRRRRALQDVMTAIRLGCTIAEAGHALFPNGERHLRRIDDLAALYPVELLAETLRIAALCTLNLRELNYEYPHELVPGGLDAIAHLRERTWKGAAEHWPAGIPEKVRAQVEKELALVAYKKYEHFFLTVEDIVRWAREQVPPILCQGRGSSANSAVCYCLGITAVDPEKNNLLFERFLSVERNEPPDIDVDFEHERREEVIQYVFNKYGRDRAALAATVISYRSKSAIRDVGRALGLPEDQLDRLTGMFSRIDSGQSRDAWLRERGFDPRNATLDRLYRLAGELRGFPRHLSQHVGGFVISEKPLHHLVPVENAAMPDRTIIQWDKDDLEEMKLLKVDCLALGMLTCLRKCLDLLHAHGLWNHAYHGEKPVLYDIPSHDDKAVYEMICRADTVGVFQIESRAQMSMLPRLQPKNFYDLVVEIAIVRPGPIQGHMVHPYLRRRKNLEPIDYPQSKFERESGTDASRVKEVLERTLGVPIFQEQVMKLIQVVADFTPGQADELRRAMAAWKRRGGLEPFHDRIRDGMRKNGYPDDYFERIFEQIKGFGEYGFPESHSASFAHLAYASSWLKHYHPAAFACALLNAQPMGFYQPSQLIQDARNHRVHVLPADVCFSEWDCTLEWLGEKPPLAADGKPASPVGLRLGLRQVGGLSQELAERLAAARRQTPFRDVAELTRRVHLKAADRARLADAGALQTLSGHRHRARWDSAGAELPTPMLADAAIHEERIALRKPSLRQDVMADYATQGLSLKGHPLALIRGQLDERRVVPAFLIGEEPRDGLRLRCAGLVTVRQHPGTAKGVTFVTLEDETGFINIVVWRALAEAQHRVLLEAVVMGVDGVLQVSEGVRHVIAKRLHDYSPLLPEFAFASRDFH